MFISPIIVKKVYFRDQSSLFLYLKPFFHMFVYHIIIQYAYIFDQSSMCSLAAVQDK